MTTNRDPSHDYYMTTDEVMAYLHINLRTVYRLIDRRVNPLPAHRVGRQWRFRKSEIDAWLLAGDKNASRRVPAADRPRILVVDDEESVRGLVAKTLTDADYEVETASDGATAIERLRGSAWDLLITDLKMPGMDGLSVIREARRHTSALPIIIITGYSSEASAIEAINLGVRYYITKPFRVPRIVSVTQRALGETSSDAYSPDAY